MTDPRELFVHELQDVYYAEKTLVKALPKLAQEATDAELERAFTHHLTETQGHVKNLEQVFEAIGERAKAEHCPGIDGIKEEHDEFMEKEDPSPVICDLFLTGAAARTESYEIAAYSGLVAMARTLGEKDAAALLDENLRQEKEALKTVQSLGRRIGRESAKQAVVA
jgi:ferritin-like metal-binding protein YciE